LFEGFPPHPIFLPFASSSYAPCNSYQDSGRTAFDSSFTSTFLKVRLSTSFLFPFMYYVLGSLQFFPHMIRSVSFPTSFFITEMRRPSPLFFRLPPNIPAYRRVTQAHLSVVFFERDEHLVLLPRFLIWCTRPNKTAFFPPLSPPPVQSFLYHVMGLFHYNLLSGFFFFLHSRLRPAGIFSYF